MKKILLIGVGLLLTAMSFAANKNFDTLIIFGDSMSDNGNLYRYMWNKLPSSPPYFEGRFTNGPLWIEQLYHLYYPQDFNEGIQDYAVAGAGALLSYKQQLPYTLAIELANYYYWNTYGKKETSLYVIWIGGNNYFGGPTNVESITDSVVDTIGDAVERIINNGGDKFLLPNLPDLGKIPYVVNEHNEALVTEIIVTHNRKLAAKVEALKLKHPEATIVYFDVFSYLKNIMNHAAEYGFTNITEPCYMGSYSGWLMKHKPTDKMLANYLKGQDPQLDSARWEMIKNNPELREAAETGYIYNLLPEQFKAQPLECDAYAFWDHVHPTARVHNYLAQKARELLDAEGLHALNP